MYPVDEDELIGEVLDLIQVFQQNREEHKMKFHKILTTSIILSIVVLPLSGCATYKTVSAAKYGSSSPRIYSGTRLDIHAISDNRYELKKYGVAPPKYPLLDLPASFALDTLILPLTVSSVLSEELGL